MNPGKRRRALTLLNIAYASITGDQREDWGMWQVAMQKVPRLISRWYAEAGCTAPPLQREALRVRVELPHPARDPLAHMRFVAAMWTPVNHILADHVEYRLAHEGNVHLEFTGPTGMGKSSCAIGLADWIKPFEPARLHEHLSIDVTELPRKLAGKLPGQTVIQDEYVQLAGEGAATARGLFANLEDTLRASQVNLFALSPRLQEHGTMQAVLEVLCWSPRRRFSVFMLWIDGVPHGVVALPWCRAEVWEAYKPFKAWAIERTRAGQFRDNTYLARIAMDCFEDKRLVRFLKGATNKPAKKDFRNAVDFYQPTMMASSQMDRLADFMHNACYAFDRIGEHFEEDFGVTPSNGFLEVARKCYAE